jgi:DNA-binding NtrC family response regulator
MRKILFVDDEPRLLEGLERMLRPQRRRWNMHFATGANEALEFLETTPVDVVVTDMRMPGIDGAALLERVQDRYPSVVRIVLSGQFGEDAQVRASAVAHQFLNKPCTPDALLETIEKHFQRPDGAAEVNLHA